MTDIELDIIAAKIAEKLLFQPRWLKLKKAALYSSINVKELKRLADAGDIVGYSDPNSKRGDWVFDKESIDKFRLQPVSELNAKEKSIVDKMERYL